MKNWTIYTLLLLLCLQQSANMKAQVPALTRIHNSMRDGDVLIKRQIQFVPPVDDCGKSVWHFSNEGGMSKGYKVAYEISGDSIFGMEHGTCYLRVCAGDSLYLMGYENKTTKMQYSKPQLEMKYPLSVGDSLYSDFEGTGLYCGKVHLGVWGKSTVIADQVGMLTNGVDTFKNVLRIHKHIDMMQKKLNDNEPDVRTDSNASDADSQEKEHMVEDHYLWYGEGWRYPIMESIESYTCHNGIKKRFYDTSFLYLPDRQDIDLPFDNENNWVRFHEAFNEDTTGNGTSQQEDAFPVSMSATYDAGSQRLVLEYTQRTSGLLKVIACDAVARPLASSSYEHGTGSYTHTLQLGNRPCSNVIVLHMELNGEKHSIKIK